jgi:hypothetical protein
MFQRIIGFLKLDIATIEAVEADESATSQAAVVVAVVAILAAIGAYFGAQAGNAIMDQMGDFDVPFDMPAISPVGAAVNALIGAFVAWIVWSALTYFIGTRLFGGRATMGEMLRVIGFAQAPRVLNVLDFIPCLGAILVFVAWIWSIVVGFVAIRQGLDLDNVKAALTVVISFVVAILINWLIIAPLLALVIT